MDNFEGNAQRYSPEDIQAQSLVKSLEQDPKVNRDHFAFLEGKAREWQREGFGHPLVFIEEDHSVVIIARYEKDDYATSEIRDEKYRILIEKPKEDQDASVEWRDVTVPHELVNGRVPEDLQANNVTFYEIPKDELPMLEVAARDDENDGFLGSVTWLQERFGDSLSAQRAGMTPARLCDDNGLRGVRLDGITPFSEADF